MTDFRVTLDAIITSTSGDLDAEVGEALRSTMAELHKLGTFDPAIMLEIGNGNGALTISCRVVVDDVRDAVPPASGDIRTALHTAEIGTPEWPGADDPRWTVEFIGTRSEALTLA